MSQSSVRARSRGYGSCIDGHAPGLTGETAESWFLTRGLPAVLTVRGRSRHLVSRVAPALAGYATVSVALLIVSLLMGSAEVYIDGTPTAAERVVLGVLALVVPLAILAGWLVTRLHDRRRQRVVSAVSVAVAAATDVIQGGVPHLLTSVVVVVLVVILTISGVGAVLGWAVQLTMSQMAAMGGLFVRALPVMLLTVVVFFNTYVWQMASSISSARLSLALAFLFAVTCAFLVSTSRSRVRTMIASISEPHDAAHSLAGTPFAGLPDPTTDVPLRRGERFNVVTVLAAAQIAHLMMVAISTAAIYFVLGLIVLSPELLAKWTGGGPSDGALLGMTIPVPQALIHMTLVLISLTFMYVSARSVGDDEYKRDFLNPLIEDLHTTLLARNRYRAND